VKYLEDVPDQQIVDLNIPTGVPLVEELDDDLKSLRHYYLGDPVRIQQAISGAASTGKANK
jgi:2,3-bisphosphoglycerate-dependent phosphoglycerate mutase